VFHQNRLKADSRKIVLCYKVQFRLRRLVNDIVDKGANKYAYVQRARNLLWALLCQAILNDAKLQERADDFGRGLGLEAQYTRNRFDFVNPQVNLPVAPNQFNFTPPPGTTIVKPG
jgi:hypothetical protein